MAKVFPTAFVFSLFVVTALFITSHHKVEATHQILIQQLFDLATAQQAKQEQKYVPIKQWFEQKGVYKSSIKLNFHGPPALAQGRRLMDVYDNNMFATAWVTSSLLEAFRFNPKTRPTNEQLLSSLDVLDAHRNMNTGYNSSMFAFWQQRYNSTVSYWASSPANLLSCFALLNDLPLPLLEDILKDLGFPAEAKIMQQIRDEEDMYLQAFHIPPDFDDTFVNLGLGALIMEMQEDFPEAWAKWHGFNTNITSALDALKKYAYRPFSKDINVNAIDPRTYFYIRGFLDQAAQKGEDVALVPTWIQNVDELRVEYHKGVVMPFQVNNVDITVAANTIFGLTSSALAGVISPDVFDDKNIAQIYLNTTSLIGYLINTNISSRPDLALTYYPSEIEFDWFVSRTTSVMDTFILEKSQLPHEVLRQAYAILTTAVKGKMTQSVLSKAKKDDHGDIYFDDFLGNGDLTFDNRTLNRAEDRIFTTTMATNALLYTWTVFDKQIKQCTWKTDAPREVKDLVAGCVRWLSLHTLDGNYDPWNAFFSGSAKGHTTFPFWYPFNLFEHLNGTDVTDWKKFPRNGDRQAVSGYVPKADYDQMITQRHYNVPTPLVFHGYNTGDGYFPFWSSEAYTYATTLLALSRFDSISE